METLWEWPNWTKKSSLHLQALRKLMDVIVRPIWVISKRSQQSGEVPEDWIKANATPVFKNEKEDPVKYRLISLPCSSGQVMEQITLESISTHAKDKEIAGNSQHGFVLGISCMTNLTAFCDEMTHSVDKGRVVYLTFSTLSPIISLLTNGWSTYSI